MALEIRHLRLVQAVAARGGLTEAGRELHLSQSALSHQLRDVESRLGAPLFLRVGKRMVLTTAGERLLRSANEVLAALHCTEEAIHQLRDSRRGRLRVTTGCDTEYHWLPRVLKKYRDVCPNVDVQIVGSADADSVQLLLDGAIDVGIVRQARTDSRVEVFRLFDDEVVAIVEPASRLASVGRLTADDLKDQTILLETPVQQHPVYQRLMGRTSVKVGAVHLVAHTSAIVELVKAGFGVGFVARWAIEPHARAGTVRAISLGPGAERQVWSAAVLKEMAAASFMRAFLETLERNVVVGQRLRRLS
jgi:LysR family transcriptional regulator for metE and metH